jgi:hypothetical protein
MVNPSNILSVTRNNDRGITFLFMPPHGTWEVCETIEEIRDQQLDPAAYFKRQALNPPVYNPIYPQPDVTITPVDPDTGDAIGDPQIIPGGAILNTGCAPEPVQDYTTVESTDVTDNIPQHTPDTAPSSVDP